MCMRVNCRQCGKPTWTGCGAHVETALAGVPVEQRCRCREERQEKSEANGSWLSFVSKALGGSR
jgi:hypothetical protein